MELFNIFNKESIREHKKKQLEQRAETLFDVTLSKNQLWLCYNGNLIAPMSMLTDKDDVNECAALVSTIRQLYVDNNL